MCLSLKISLGLMTMGSNLITVQSQTNKSLNFLVFFLPPSLPISLILLCKLSQPWSDMTGNKHWHLAWHVLVISYPKVPYSREIYKNSLSTSLMPLGLQLQWPNILWSYVPPNMCAKIWETLQGSWPLTSSYTTLLQRLPTWCASSHSWEASTQVHLQEAKRQMQ